MEKGYLCLVLHAHLPFVRHPEEEYFLEENWLFEAITDTYIPLIDVFDQLIKEGVYFRITMSLTPTLVSMLSDSLLQERYIKYIDRLIELSEKEIDRTSFNHQLHRLALMYNKRFKRAREVFVDKYKRDLVSAFREFHRLGVIEIIASCATHAYLPNFVANVSSIRAQINLGIDFYRHIFGQVPQGFWLPECGYTKMIDRFLKEARIRYTFLDSHGIINAVPSPRYSVYAPLYSTSGIAFFGRDWESSKQVWSAREGYPGDYDYREYYRDLGYEAEYEYIKPYIHPLGFRINTGIKYWRITGDTEYKELYQPGRAKEKADIHAGNFMFNREKQVEYLYSYMGRKPIIVAPYDAELFGHWWFEGPVWLDFLIRKLAYDQHTVKMITCSEYLNEYSVNQKAEPSPSSWGWKGYSEVWLEGSNDWIYLHLHTAAEKMEELASLFLKKKIFRRKLVMRALNQAARELLLAQASDWPFIMKTKTMVSYAEKRIKIHLSRFNKLYDDIVNSSINEEWLAEVEKRDNIFYNMDCFRYYLGDLEKNNYRDNKNRLKDEVFQ